VRKGHLSQSIRKETSARMGVESADQDLAMAEKMGARFVIPEDDEWPAWPLHALELAVGRGVKNMALPIGLWVRGAHRLDEAADSAIGIVGARAATTYGEHTASEFGYELASRGVPVFSGAAYGIDGAAHRGALAAAGVTVAVLGCAVDVDYPAGHVALLSRIAENGLVISEYPPGTPPARHRFLVRNRLIAAMTGGTLVVEAGTRSGARNTASTADLLGKVVMAVPGPIGSAMSVGCHQLIRDSTAILVSSVDEVLEAAGKMGEGLSEPQRISKQTDHLDRQALQIYDTLTTRGGKQPEQISLESGVALSKVRAILPELEMEDLVFRCEVGWRRAKI
jgi:DNA processing protein